jgi:hypothetical protein
MNRSVFKAEREELMTKQPIQYLHPFLKKVDSSLGHQRHLIKIVKHTFKVLKNA